MVKGKSTFEDAGFEVRPDEGDQMDERLERDDAEALEDNSWLDDDVCEDDSEGRYSCHNQEIGMRGEEAAARYLKYMGYEILARNWVCPAGEADIIARDGSALVFVEVKTRTGIEKGFPSEAITPEKRARYEKIAAYYLRDYDDVDFPVRFDVMALMVIRDDRAFVRHYVNAFGVEHW